MALPTVWQLLIPSFSITTIIGIVLILIGVFKGFILGIVAKFITFLTGNEVSGTSLSLSFIGSGALMVWLPNILKRLFESVEGILVIVAVVLLLLIFLVLLSKPKQGSKRLSL